MIKLKHLFSVICLLFVASIYGQERKMYVDNFANILGTYHLEQELFDFVEANDIDELILYDLNKVHKRFPLGDVSQNQILADFICKAKKHYGVTSVSASGETGDFFIKAIHPYNKSREIELERFDIYNIEYEYWNKKESLDNGYYCETYLKNEQLKCNRENSFGYFMSSLKTMKELAKKDNLDIKTEAYVGKYTRDEVDEISSHVDKLLIHDYVRDPKYSYMYVKDRLNQLDAIHSHIEVSILFSYENNFMGKWLKNHRFQEAEESFHAELAKNDVTIKDHLNFTGFTYYNYSWFKRNKKLD